ncbi:MAG: efflux RND transporter periplasmic adaptor subunit [Burkholderiaceae bacterium]|nr:efflux RND transporter periplasmic adaptor subunit [Burkholderiaceae bacterium]
MARQELARVRAEREGVVRQRANLRLVAPVAGIVAARAVDPGTTVVVGQAVVDVVDPSALWLNVRFDQLRASGLRAGLPARIALRSRSGESIPGQVARAEPVADAVTEEALAKIAFEPIPQPPPAIGELAQVTIALPARPAVPVVPNASIQRSNGQAGAWVVDGGSLRFAPVRLGASDLDGHVEVLEGLKEGERIVVYSERALDARTRIEIVDRLAGARP